MADSLNTSRTSRLPYPIKIGLVVIGFVLLMPIASAETVKLLENTDNCKYIPKLDMDYCYSKYEICDISLSDVEKSTFVFKDEKSGYKDDLSSIYSKNITIVDKGICKELTISAYKNPFKNVDNVICTTSKCYYEYVWWNSSFRFKFPINASTSSGEITAMILLNDSNGILIDGFTQYVWCNYTVNETRRVVGYFYFTNETFYRCVDETETFSVFMNIDEGNGTDFGVGPDDDFIVWWHANTTKDDSIYSHTVTNNGALRDADGKIGNAFDFAVSDEDTIDISSVPGSQNVTFTFWANPDPDALGIAWHGAVWTWGSLNWYAPFSSNTGRFLVHFGGSAGPCCVVDTGEGQYNVGEWHYWAVTLNDTGCLLYKDGEILNSSAATTACLSNTYTLHLGCNGQANQCLDGMIDEWKYFNRTLTNDEIKAEYNNTEGTQNFAPFGPIDILPVNTSLLGFGFNISDFSFSSGAFVSVFNSSFNTTEDSRLVLLSSMNAQKISGGASNLISVRVLVDNNIILEEDLRTVSSTDDIGSVGTNPLLFNISSGEHNIEYQFKRTGNGAIGITNMDLSLIEMFTNSGFDVISNQVNISYSHSSLSFVTAFNWTVEKIVNSSTIIIVKQTIDKVLAGDSVPSYRFLDFFNNNESPFWSRLLSGSSDVGSVSSVFIQGIEEPTHDWSLLSIQTNPGDTVNVNGSLVYFDLTDLNGDNISNFQTSNILTNDTNSINLTAGTHLLARENVTIRNGDCYFLSMSTTFSSLSGSQTPIYFINSSTQNVTCRSEKSRYISSSSDVGNAFLYFFCPGLVVDNSYLFDLYVTVEGGETLTQIEESFSGLESRLLDVSLTNVPPIPNIITNPSNNSDVTGDDTITWLAFFDPNGGVITYEVTLRDLNNTLVSVIGTTTSLSQAVNWDGFLPDDYILMVEGCDPTDLCSNSTILITVLPIPLMFPPSITSCEDENILLVRTSTNTTTDLVSEVVVEDSRTFCQYGCSNWTISTLGNPGCEEGDFWLSLVFIIVLILVILIIRGAAK